MGILSNVGLCGFVGHLNFFRTICVFLKGYDIEICAHPGVFENIGANIFHTLTFANFHSILVISLQPSTGKISRCYDSPNGISDINLCVKPWEVENLSGNKGFSQF